MTLARFNNNVTKKQGERLIIEAFLDGQGLPASALTEWDREGPDALITVKGRTVGVEITSISEAVPRQPMAALKWTVEARRAVEAASRAFASSSPASLIVRFEFKPDWIPPHRGVSSELAAELAAIVSVAASKLAPEAKRPLQLRNPHQGISRAYVARSSTGSAWQPSFAYSGMSATEADLRATVARKEPKLVQYRRVVPEVWLLVYCNLTGQDVALGVPTTGCQVVTGFNRLWCCGFGLWEWVEVQCLSLNASEGAG